MKLPVKQGFDLEAFRAGVPAVTRGGDIEVFDCESLKNALFGIKSRTGRNYKRDGSFIMYGEDDYDLTGMLVLGNEGVPSDAELLARFVCATTSGRHTLPEKVEEKEIFASEYLDFSEVLLDEYKRRLVKRGLVNTEETP